jgi:hypothetical protein
MYEAVHMSMTQVHEVQIYEQPMVVHHNHVIHVIHFFPPIILASMGQIVPMFTYFNESPINESIVALKLRKLCNQN